MSGRIPLGGWQGQKLLAVLWAALGLGAAACGGQAVGQGLLYESSPGVRVSGVHIYLAPEELRPWVEVAVEHDRPTYYLVRIVAGIENEPVRMTWVNVAPGQKGVVRFPVLDTNGLPARLTVKAALERPALPQEVAPAQSQEWKKYYSR